MKKKYQENNWSSRWGFILAASSSAIGLANIWRFPFLVGQYGGGAFFFIYFLCLILIAIPLFVLEVLIGKESARSPAEAMYELSRSYVWKAAGLMLVFTAFLVSCYYSVIAGWVAGYWAEAMTGKMGFLKTPLQAREHYSENISSFSFSFIWPQVFFLTSALIVGAGIRAGLERASRYFVPVLFILLTGLVIWSSYKQDIQAILWAMFYPDWTKLNSEAALAALGQAFFTLSLGQGTMITYGSYLRRNEALVSLVLPVVIADTMVSVLATLLIFSICFQTGVAVDSGPGLIFETMPVMFNHFALGSVIGVIFFSILLLATLTAQMSALEPVVSWLSPKMGRRRALFASAAAVLLVMLPAAYSYRGVVTGLWSSPYVFWAYDALCTKFLIPLGGALTIFFAHRAWGIPIVMRALERTDFQSSIGGWFFSGYFHLCFKWAAPILIIVIFVHSLLGN